MTTSTRQLTIASGDLGTEQTVAAMGDLIRDGALTPAVRDVATQIAGAVDDPLRQLMFLRSWVDAHFKFVRDPASGELLHTPENLLAQVRTQGVARGDCDDAAILAGALACAIGFHVALITVAVGDPSPNAPLSHVWATCSPPTDCPDRSGRQVWIEFDVTRPAQYDALAHITRAEAAQVC